jgi:hypothetical protein
MGAAANDDPHAGKRMQKLFSPLGYLGAIVLVWLGLTPMNVASWLQMGVNPAVSSWIASDQARWAFVLVGIGVALFVRKEGKRRRGHAVPAMRGDPLAATTITVTEIAEYLRDKSSWGWRQRRLMTFKRFVQDAVPAELDRLARSGQVRFLGTRPNEMTAMQINIGYWDVARFDGDRIWDKRNEFFTTTPRMTFAPGLFQMRHGRAPRDEVMSAWPAASLPLRLFVLCVLWCRRARQGFPAAMRE